MWLHLAESVVGTSHVQLNTECQDCCGTRLGTAADESALVFAASDGAGSALFSAVGARLVVDKFMSEICALSTRPDAITKENIAAVCEKIRSALIVEAETLGCSLRELSATLLGGCITREFAWFCQIGDGGIVAHHDGKYHAVTWPSSGEFVNTTTFITSSEWLTDLQFVSIRDTIEAAAAFTDGIQDLVLVHADKSVHAAFFDPILATMRNVADGAALSGGLRTFLGSKPINERTDDDKTLVLACWRENHACPP